MNENQMNEKPRGLVLSDEPGGGEVVPLDPVSAIFSAWIEATGRTDRTVLSPKRRRLIRGALADYPPEDVLDAVRGWRNSPHHCGDNERGTTYNAIELLLRDAEHIEKFRDLERSGPRPAVRRRAGLEAVARDRGWS